MQLFIFTYPEYFQIIKVLFKLYQPHIYKPWWKKSRLPCVINTLLNLKFPPYFQDLPEDENDIILEADGSWKPVPKEEEAGGAEAAAAAAKKKAEEKEVDCIDLSDDEEGGAPQPPRPPTNMDGGNPPLPPQPPPPVIQNIPMPPSEIECIDLD